MPWAKLWVPLTLLLAAGIVAVVVWRGGKPGTGRARIGFQEADQALAMPATGAPDHRFALLTAWQRAEIPTAVRFDPPLGSEHGGLTYNAQKFREMNETRGGPHLGDDLNGIGGMNSDLGDPVFAVADGLVIHAGEPAPGWGNILVLAHHTPDGRELHSMYAHLDKMAVGCGTLVARGARIGSVGTANDNYPAHLHFEIRDSREADIGSGYGESPLNRLDPAATVAGLRGAAADALAPSALAVMLRPADDPWSRLETKDAKSAERLLEIISGMKAAREGKPAPQPQPR
jgi:hypothetical protein